MSDQKSKLNNYQSLTEYLKEFSKHYSDNVNDLVRLFEGDRGYDAAIEAIGRDSRIDLNDFHDAYLYLTIFDNCPQRIGLLCAYLGLSREYRAAGAANKRMEFYYSHGQENADSTLTSGPKYAATNWLDDLSVAVYNKWKPFQSLRLANRVLRDFNALLEDLYKTLFLNPPKRSFFTLTASETTVGSQNPVPAQYVSHQIPISTTILANDLYRYIHNMDLANTDPNTLNRAISLANVYFAASEAYAKGTSTFMLCGEPGTGKTLFSDLFVEMSKLDQTYDLIHYLDAANESSLQQSILELLWDMKINATGLSPEDQRQAAIDYLKEHDRWLLVFRNTDYMSPVGSGSNQKLMIDVLQEFNCRTKERQNLLIVSRYNIRLCKKHWLGGYLERRLFVPIESI